MMTKCRKVHSSGIEFKWIELSCLLFSAIYYFNYQFNSYLCCHYVTQRVIFNIHYESCADLWIFEIKPYWIELICIYHRGPTFIGHIAFPYFLLDIEHFDIFSYFRAFSKIFFEHIKRPSWGLILEDQDMLAQGNKRGWF